MTILDLEIRRQRTEDEREIARERREMAHVKDKASPRWVRHAAGRVRVVA